MNGANQLKHFFFFLKRLYKKVQCKEVKNTTSLSVIMLLIGRHVSAYSEAIISFNNFELYEVNIFHGIY